MKWFRNRYFALGAVFSAGTACGIWLWEKINLPFSNPLDILSLLSYQKQNPSNDLVRFLVLTALPSALLVVIYFLYGKKFFSSDDPAARQPAAENNTKSGPNSLKTLPAVILLALFCVLGALVIPTDNEPAQMDIFHEGVPLASELAYSSGAVPYRDFFLTYGVLYEPLSVKAAYNIFGRSVGAVRSLRSVFKIIMYLLLLWTLLLVFEGNAFLAGAGLFFIYWLNTTAVILFFTSFQYEQYTLRQLMYLATRDIPVIIFLASSISMFYCAGRMPQKKKGFYAWSLITAAIVPLTFAYSLDRAVYITAAYMAAIPLLYIAFVHGRQWAKQFLLSSALGFLSGFLTLCWLLRWALADFIKSALLAYPEYWDLMMGLNYPVLKNAAADIGLLAFIPLLLISANTFWISLKLLGEASRSKDGFAGGLKNFIRGYFPEFVLWLVSVIVFKTALGRSDWPHITVSMPFTFLLSSYILLKHYLWPFLKKNELENHFKAFVTAFLLAGSVFFCVKLSSGNVLENNFPYGKPDSSLVQEGLLPAIKFLNDNLKPGEDVFSFTSEPGWYYFTNRRCPVYFSEIFNASPQKMQEQAIRDLSGHNVKFVIYSTGQIWENIDGINTAYRVPLIARYIYDNYAPYQTIGTVHIWKTKKNS